MKITKLTNNGRIHSAAISPDGNYIAYVIKEGEQRSLWVKYLATNSNIQITQPEIEAYMAPAFSLDSNYIYFVRSDYGGYIRWTPDGRALTYITYLGSGDSRIWMQPTDGSEPRVLTDFKSGQVFCFDWSADGKNLIVAHGNRTTDVVLIGRAR